MSKMYFVCLLMYMDNFYFHCHCQFSWFYFLGPINQYCDLPSPTWKRRMSKMHFVSLLIYMANFYLPCHCQFSWTYSLGSTNVYRVLPSPTKVPSMSINCLGPTGPNVSYMGPHLPIIYFLVLLVYTNKSYYHCHGQFSCQKFSKTYKRTYTFTHVPTPGKLTYRGGTGPPKNSRF